MKKIVSLTILLVSILYSDNSIIIFDREKDSDALDILIRENREECKVSMNHEGQVLKTTCLQLTNSIKTIEPHLSEYGKEIFTISNTKEHI